MVIYRYLCHNDLHSDSVRCSVHHSDINIIRMVKKYDFLVIGSGIAGMSFALKVAHRGTVALVCKSELEEANTY